MKNLRHQPIGFNNKGLALGFIEKSLKPMRLMLGENKFWVVCPADSAKLEKLGYEFAE